MQKCKRILCTMISIFMLSTLLAACASKEQKNDSNASTTQAAPQKIVEITQLAWDRGTVPPDQGMIEENWWTKYVNEKVARMGIKVKFIPIPRAQEGQKLPTMLAAGEAPDLCFTYDKNLLNLYIKNNALVDFTDLFVKYGTNIKKLQSQEDLDAGKINGKQYTFVHKSNGYANATFVRKDWLDKLGLKEPTNVEEFYAMLKAFKEKDPGKLGDKLVPFGVQSSASQSFLMWDTVILPGFVKDSPNGERLVTPVAMWPESKEALRFMNKLYNEKLLGEFLLDKDGSLFKQKVIRGEVGAFPALGHWPYHSAYGGIYEKMQQNNPEAKLVALFPWKNKDSKEDFYNLFASSMYYYQFFSPSTTKNSELVMKYLDWMASDEGYKNACLGMEGTDYTLDNGIPKIIDDKKYASRIPWIEPQYMAFSKPYSTEKESELYLKNLAKDFPEKFRAQFIKETITSDKMKYITPRINLTTPVADKLLSSIKKKWEEDMAKMVVAPEKDFDKLFDDAVKVYKSGGGDDVAKEAVDVYKQQYYKK